MLAAYADSSCVRFHMPGHGGAGYDNFLKHIFKFDVTENTGTDNLYSPNLHGSVEKTFEKLKEIYKSKASVISAHGATAAIQAAVYSCVILKGKRFLIDRYSHASVLNAMALCGCTYNCFSSFDEFSSSISENANSTVILTSPNYYGKMEDVKKYAGLCKSHNCLLIVDNSHGSHLPWHSEPSHPLWSGADFSVDSFHKTLPVLTGGAVLHSNVCDKKLLLKGIKLFASTSPSYLIAASVDTALDFMQQHGKRQLAELGERIDVFVKSLSGAGIEREMFAISDPYRITLRSSTVNGLLYDMNELREHLENENIFPEFSDKESCVLIPSIFNSEKDFLRLSNAIHGFSSFALPKCSPVKAGLYPVCKRQISLSDAVFSRSTPCPTVDSLGKISSQIKYIYPPGIPIITPGEIIDENVVEALIDNNIYEIDVIIDEKS